MKITKAFTLLLAASLLVLLVSCGIIAGENSTPSAEASQTVSVQESSEEPQPDESEAEPSADVPAGGSINIVVLGDSIACGYGLADYEHERYSALLGEMLKERYDEVIIANYGIDGQTGRELADSLASNPPAELAEADAVVISIGGNNVLTRLSELFSDSEMFNEETAAALKDYFTYMLASDSVGQAKFASAAENLNGILKKVNSAFDSGEFDALIADAANKLREELPAIVSAVRGAGAKRVLVQTIYNPYYDMVINLRGVETKLDLAERGEQSVAELNKVINELASANGYETVEIHDAFSASLDKLTNSGIDLTSAAAGMPLNFGVDPHPNALGHQLIAELVKDKILG
ncbi:MAG: SGNH/GDSL hydrolase family protein [Clostridia bacterium]|nr:SGNH/GDSL hydrolase family protein [Clostridia bacterium]